jgi:opacity protein-like surface antigen
MKQFLTAAVLAAVLASPAMAQQKLWSSDTASPHSSVATQWYNYDSPNYIGHDPDPRIESELRRDLPNDR